MYIVPWFLLPSWTLEEYGGCVLPGRKISVDLIPWSAWLVYLQGILVGVVGQNSGMICGKEFGGEDLADP